MRRGSGLEKRSAKTYHDQYGLDVRIGRLFNSHVPSLRAEGFQGRTVARFLLQSFKGEDVTVFGDGSQTMSFCYAADTVTGLLRLTGKEDWRGRLLTLEAWWRRRLSAEVLSRMRSGRAWFRKLNLSHIDGLDSHLIHVGEDVSVAGEEGGSLHLSRGDMERVKIVEFSGTPMFLVEV